MAASIGAGLLLTLVLSLLFMREAGFLSVLQTPEEISHMAAGYLRIISAGLMFLL